MDSANPLIRELGERCELPFDWGDTDLLDTEVFKRPLPRQKSQKSGGLSLKFTTFTMLTPCSGVPC